jgi:putative transcriptional regulator
MAKTLHRIKEVLKEKQKSAYWLAKETEISYNSIHAYIHNRTEPSLTNLFRIATALRVNPRELINSEALHRPKEK